MKRYILYLLALIFMQDVRAQASGSLTGTQVTINGLNYRLDEETQEATLDNGNSWEGALSLPSVVNYNGKDYPVTRIGWLAFAFCETLTGIKIPGTVREILHYAASEGCKNPFLGCTNLESIEVDENNEWMCSVDGVLFSKDKTWLYAYPAGAQRSSYNIPDGVTTIAGDAFSYNLSLRSVVMPNSVEKAFFSTFNGCRNLENVRFSENLKSLGAYSFDNCESIRVIDLPKSVSYFAESVFRWTHLDALVVRGTFPKDLRSDTFYFVSESMIIYAQSSEIPKFKKVFSGTVLPLEDYVDSATTYHPFVEACKSWCMVTSNQEEQPSDTKVSFEYFDCKEIEVDGKKYLPMYSRESWHYECEVRRVGLFREDGRKVFARSSETEEETMLYDFSLEVGETYHHPFYGDFKVTKVGDIVVNDEHLKTISFNGSEEPDWIEGIGSLNSLIWEPVVLPGMFFEKIAYVNYSDGDVEWGTIYEHDYKYGDEGVRFPEHYYYLPLSFLLYTPEGHWRGQPLETIVPKDVYEQYEWKQQQENLNYEMGYNVESNTYDLHVSGFMVLNCGPNHYIYCIDEQTADSNTHRLTLQHEDVPPLMDCEGGHKVDFVISGFNKDCTYTVVDERGEHPVAVRDVSYRPFIEEGKVWKVGYIQSNNIAIGLENYYLKGDTIINSQPSKKMMCCYEFSPQLQGPEHQPRTEYVAALYEKDCCVYAAFPHSDKWELIYDFKSPVGSIISLFDTDYYVMSTGLIRSKQIIHNELFHGMGTFVERLENGEYIEYGVWKEGVGYKCLLNVDNKDDIDCGYIIDLMSCTVGDEILYYNPYLIDGVTPPDGAEVKRQWLDFTHIKKPRPRAPRKEGYGMIADEGSDAETLTGEYSIKDLFVNFKPLSGAYTITVTDAYDEEVYHKEVQTDNVIALNTALSTYAPGTYTLTVENAEEAYTATFILDDETAVRDIPSDSTINRKSVNSNCYDLSGRQIPQSSFLNHQLKRGIYIRDGKKIVVR